MAFAVTWTRICSDAVEIDRVSGGKVVPITKDWMAVFGDLKSIFRNDGPETLDRTVATCIK